MRATISIYLVVMNCYYFFKAKEDYIFHYYLLANSCKAGPYSLLKASSHSRNSGVIELLFAPSGLDITILLLSWVTPKITFLPFFKPNFFFTSFGITQDNKGVVISKPEGAKSSSIT